MFPKITDGTKLAIHYLIGNKFIGNGEVIAVYHSSICVEMETGSKLYCHNPEAPNVRANLEVWNGRESIITYDADTPETPVFRYEFIFEPEVK